MRNVCLSPSLRRQFNFQETPFPVDDRVRLTWCLRGLLWRWWENHPDRQPDKPYRNRRFPQPSRHPFIE